MGSGQKDSFDIRVRQLRVSVISEQLEGERVQHRREHDVFVSHSVADRSRLDRLLLALRNFEIQHWISPEGLSPGADWASSIMHNLKLSKMLVVAWSENSAQSDFVKMEIGAMMVLGRPVIPLLLDGKIEKLPYYLTKLQAVDYTADLEPLIARIRKESL